MGPSKRGILGEGPCTPRAIFDTGSVRLPHPVSGVIATCGLLHKKTTKAMVDRVKHYGMHFNDLISKMGYQLPVRMEGVTVLFESGKVPDKVNAQHFLRALLCNEAMLLPFQEVNGEGFHLVTSAVISNITRSLEDTYKAAQQQGGYDNSWKAYQLELALEEFFHGQPRSCEDSGYSMSLGTSSVNIESLTMQ